MSVFQVNKKLIMRTVWKFTVCTQQFIVWKDVNDIFSHSWLGQVFWFAKGEGIGVWVWLSFITSDSEHVFIYVLICVPLFLFLFWVFLYFSCKRESSIYAVVINMCSILHIRHYLPCYHFNVLSYRRHSVCHLLDYNAFIRFCQKVTLSNTIVFPLCDV